MTRHDPKRRAAFTLVELMIAIVLLGLGMLFIAAALPVGIEYSRRNVAAGNGEAAAANAVQTVQLSVGTALPIQVRLSTDPPSPALATGPRQDRIFRPRSTSALLSPPAPGPLSALDWHEPMIKVRPLTVRNIQMINDGVSKRGAHVVDAVEEVIGRYLDTHLLLGPSNGEWDNALDIPAPLYLNPAASAVARVFPPIDSITRLSPGDFFAGLGGGLVVGGAVGGANGKDYPAYGSRNGTDLPGLFGVEEVELRKAMERRIAWTVFYRRIEYPTFVPNPFFNNPEPLFGAVAGPTNATRASDGDPLRYELIIVITERATLSHRYPHQIVTGGAQDFRRPRASIGSAPLSGSPSLQLTGSDRLAPMPWLVVFRKLPAPPGPWHSSTYFDAAVPPIDRFALSSVSERPSLTFICSPELGRVLPVGSILIPARNDYRPTQFVSQAVPEWVGFIPNAPEDLPIYRVVERPDDTTVLVENNGFYPWILNTLGSGVGPFSTSAPPTYTDVNGEFPFWIIPPAFDERMADGDRTPVYERDTPIVKVLRKLVRLPQLP